MLNGQGVKEATHHLVLTILGDIKSPIASVMERTKKESCLKWPEHLSFLIASFKQKHQQRNRLSEKTADYIWLLKFRFMVETEVPLYHNSMITLNVPKEFVMFETV